MKKGKIESKSGSTDGTVNVWNLVNVDIPLNVDINVDINVEINVDINVD